MDLQSNIDLFCLQTVQCCLALFGGVDEESEHVLLQKRGLKTQNVQMCRKEVCGVGLVK